MQKDERNERNRSLTRREFLQRAALGAGALFAGPALAEGAFDSPLKPHPKSAGPFIHLEKFESKPNFILIISDQLGLDALSAHGCIDAHTPNMDRLVKRGVTFIQSHSCNSVCSPARSALFTGRMPVETGVISNDRPINPKRPVLGEWLKQAGYETFYCGKWHLPHPVHMGDAGGFISLPSASGEGMHIDRTVSRVSEAWLRNRKGKAPFFLVSSLVSPHDICWWAIQHDKLVPKELPFPELKGKLPELPPNHRSQPPAPERLARTAFKYWSDEQWRYYLYIYYRHVEKVDAHIGRLLQALEDSHQAENTIVILTADHGDGRGRHLHVQKWYPYEEAVKVPLVFSCPGRLAEGVRDETHLVSGLELTPTVCDYAGIKPPPGALGRSLRPLLEGKTPAAWHDYVVSEVQITGRMLRTERFKYVRYEGDPVEQLFDMENDPWEEHNLYQSSHYADVLKEHRRLLDEWNAKMDVVPPSPVGGW